jgi:hypothetical protein
MSALRRILKVKGGYEVTVSCTKKPTLTAFYRTYEQCEKFADDYFFDYLGVQLKSVHHPEGDGVEPDGVNPESLETVEIEIPMTNEQASDWAYKMICCLGISTSNSDINVVGLHKTVKELYEQGRADEREACAALVEADGRIHPKAPDAVGAKTVAKLIRARGEK